MSNKGVGKTIFRMMALLFVLLPAGPADAQTAIPAPHLYPEKKQGAAFFRIDWQGGRNKTTSTIPWISDLVRSSAYQGFDIRAGIRTSPEQPWAGLLNYPEYGVGFTSLYYKNFEVEEMIGNPNAVYLFGVFPFFSGSFFRLALDMAGGLGFDLKPYDVWQNPFNDMIGSRLLAYFDFGISGRFRLLRNLDVSLGGNLIHLSNGRIRTPNKGVNMIGLKLGLIHYFGTSPSSPQYTPASFSYVVNPAQSSSPVFTKRRTTYVNLSMAFGVNSTNRGTLVEMKPDFIGPSYLIAALLVEGAWKYGGVAALSLGLNFHYDGSLGEAYADTGGAFGEKSTFGLALGHEFFVHRVGIIIQTGWYPFLNSVKQQERGNVYLRGGVRWRFSDKWWCYVALKTMNKPVADFIEWGVGVSLFKKREKALPIETQLSWTKSSR